MANTFQQEITTFLASKRASASEARQIAALQIVCGQDLAKALDCSPEARSKLVLQLERRIERERLRGARKHWSYDLNRHIALKQVLDRLKCVNNDQHCKNPQVRSRTRERIGR